MEELRGALFFYRPPPVVLGWGRSRLADKFYTLMHALFLDGRG